MQKCDKCLQEIVQLCIYFNNESTIYHHTQVNVIIRGFEMIFSLMENWKLLYISYEACCTC